jgi:hypothetical protein
MPDCVGSAVHKTMVLQKDYFLLKPTVLVMRSNRTAGIVRVYIAIHSHRCIHILLMRRPNFNPQNCKSAVAWVTV